MAEAQGSFLGLVWVCCLGPTGSGGSGWVSSLKTSYSFLELLGWCAQPGRKGVKCKALCEAARKTHEGWWGCHRAKCSQSHGLFLCACTFLAFLNPTLSVLYPFPYLIFKATLGGGNLFCRKGNWGYRHSKRLATVPQKKGGEAEIWMKAIWHPSWKSYNATFILYEKQSLFFNISQI